MLKNNTEYIQPNNVTTNVHLDSHKVDEGKSDQVINGNIYNTQPTYENQIDLQNSPSIISHDQYSSFLRSSSQVIDEEDILKDILEEKFRSKFKGVFKCGRRYKAQIQINKAQHYLGVYNTELEAAIAYDDHARMVLGKKAKTNFDYDSSNSKHLSLPGSSGHSATLTPPNMVYDQITTSHINNPVVTAASLLQYNINHLNHTALSKSTSHYGNISNITKQQPYHSRSSNNNSQQSLFWQDPYFPKATKRTYVGLKVKRKALGSQLRNSALPILPQGYHIPNIILSPSNASYSDSGQYHHLNGTTTTNTTTNMMNSNMNASNALLLPSNDLNHPEQSMYDNDATQRELEVYQQYQLYQKYLQYQQIQQAMIIKPSLMPSGGGSSYLPINNDSYLQMPQDINYFNIENNMIEHGQAANTTNTASIDNTTSILNKDDEDDDMDWRDQLYYWTGKLYYVATTKQLNWLGVWVGSYTGKPSIEEFSNSKNIFEYTSEFVIDASQISADDGSLKPLSSYYLGYYLMDNNGSGLLEKYLDHEYYMEFELISNTFRGSHYSVVGKGDSEFGCFIVTGLFCTDTGLLEMTRQYISEADIRCSMNMKELKKIMIYN